MKKLGSQGIARQHPRNAVSHAASIDGSSARGQDGEHSRFASNNFAGRAYRNNTIKTCIATGYLI